MNTRAHFPLYLTAVFLGIFFFIIKDDPFFGDAISTVSRAAVTMYEQDLRTAWYLPQHDPGHPTLFPYLLAVLWKVFGKSLWLAHLLTCIFSFLVMAMVFRITGRFIAKKDAWISLVLMGSSALFISQSAMILTHLPLTFFFLVCTDALLRERKWTFIIAATALFYTHLEASFLFLGLGIADLLVQRRKMSFYRWLRIRFVWYAIPFIAFSAWVAAHYIHSGWALLSPNYMGHRTPAEFIPFVFNLVLIGWRLIDYGHIILFLPFFTLWKIRERPKPLLIFTITCMLVLAVCVAYFLDRSIAHRYFLPVWALLVILNAWWLSRLSVLKKAVLIPVYVLLLIGGSFWYYPGKCLGDATLAYRHYFILAEQIKADFGNTTFYSYAPTSSPARYTWLKEGEGLHLQPLYEARMDTVSYVLGSSFTCEFSADQEQQLATWYARSYESGFVHATVYANPLYVKEPIGWHRREAGRFERWMQKWKKKIKNSE